MPSTAQNYDLDRARKALTATQRAAADALLHRRPAVVAGTRVIIDEAARLTWYDTVTREMRRLELPDRLTGAFCDLAGVPD